MALNDIFCVPLKLRLEDTIARQYKKRKMCFLFVLFSLIRTFVAKIRHLII